MCMFKFRNKASGKALVKGVEFFECGACPECLQKKSRKWALRCGMEALNSCGVMVTLTYDTYKYVDGILSSEENPVNPDIPLSKKHCQDFLKRVRKWLSKRTDKKMKYILTAERGKRTNRAHYHALLFNVSFDDLRPYKKSGRGNLIYKSQTLDKLWSHGICTVDCINLSAKTARYCTKYCAKDSGADDSFMLFSHGIGDSELLKRFNGKSYWLDGREYSIPREIWNKYIEKKYNLLGMSKYVSRVSLENTQKIIYNRTVYIEKKSNNILISLFNLNYKLLRHIKKLRNFRKGETRKKYFDKLYFLKNRIFALESELHYYDELLSSIWNERLTMLENSDIVKATQDINREIFLDYRDNDPLYQSYLFYWSEKNRVNDYNRPDDLTRISMLPDKKYWSYRQKAFCCKARQEKKFSFVPPRSNCSAFDPFSVKKNVCEKSFAPLSRHYRANDTLRNQYSSFLKKLRHIEWQRMQQNMVSCEFNPFSL